MRTSEHSYVQLVEAEGKATRVVKPDVALSGPSPSAPEGKPIAIAEPETDTESVQMRAFVVEEFRESVVEIYYESDTRHLVTCIEVLSPSNKRRSAEGWDLYLRKRQALLMGQANFIEIDLLRGGEKFPMLDPWPTCPYTLLV